MPNAIATSLAAMHLRYKQRAGGTPEPNGTPEPIDHNGEAWPAPHKVTNNHPECGALWSRPPHGPRLHLPLEDYPLIRACLAKLENDHPRKDFLRFADPLITKTGCDTIGELMELVYADLKNGKYGASPTDALDDYLTKALGSEPPRRLVSLMIGSFENTARTFEGRDDEDEED